MKTVCNRVDASVGSIRVKAHGIESIFDWLMAFGHIATTVFA